MWAFSGASLGLLWGGSEPQPIGLQVPAPSLGFSTPPLRALRTHLPPVGHSLAGSPHQVVNVGGDAAPTTAISMNYVDASNAFDAARASLEAAEIHPRFRSRLRKRSGEGGALVSVPGSQARSRTFVRHPLHPRYALLRDACTSVFRRPASVPTNVSMATYPYTGALVRELRDGLVPLQRRYDATYSYPYTGALVRELQDAGGARGRS